MTKTGMPAALALVALLGLSAVPASAHDALRPVADMAADHATVEAIEGRLHALVVDNPARGTSHRYVELDLDDGSRLPLDGSLAANLAEGARVSVSGTRNGKMLAVASVRVLAPGSGQPKAGIEIEGTLAVLHADDFEQGRSSFLYELREAAGRAYTMRVASLPGELAPGMHVRVAARVAADAASSITPDRITVLAEPASVAPSQGPLVKAAIANTALVILANFNNTAMPAFASSQAQQVMTSNADSVGNFFRETSYGQQLMNVTVTPSWVTMNMARPATCGYSDWSKIGSSAEAAAKALGSAYDPALYNFVVYLFPGVGACGWTGLAYVGYPHKAWINGTSAFKTATIAHEMGHNFGLLHAGSLRCSGAIVGSACSVSEYGDPFDAMGNQRAMHYSAMQKASLDWIPATSVKTHASGAATYTLTPLEFGGGDTYAVKIPTASANRTYWIEFRQPIGFDAPLASYANAGAEIRLAAPFENYCPGCDSYSNDTQLLDMTPGTSAFTDATLPSGQTFTDTTYGINVTVLSASPSGLTVQVSTGGTGTAPPAASSTSVSGTPNPSLAGAVTTFAATVSGNAPTGTVRFTDNGNAIYGCAVVPLSGSGNILSATCTTNALVAGIHSIGAAYSGDSANATSSATASLTVNDPVNGTNVALAVNGGVASASSVYGPSFAPSGVVDGRRSGASWGNYAGWADGTAGAFPDWLQVNFNGAKTIDHVVVYSVQDDYQNPAEPTDTMTGTRFVLSSFTVQGWSGTAWVTLAMVTGNAYVKRTVSFSPYTTDRVRIVVDATQDGVWSRMTELEAWTSSAVRTNYASGINGGSAGASSTWGPSFPAWTAIDGTRSGAGWGNYAGWADGTSGSFPDWLQVNLKTPKAIDRVVVYSVQDAYLSPIEPTDATTGTRFVLSSFDVQAWSGSSWVTLASVGGNNLIKRTVSFTPYVTSAVRILIGATQDGVWSRVTEVEAWGQ